MTATEDQYWADLAATVEADLLTRIPENKLRPRLEPTRRAVELLGDPQKSYRVIHVTGTNGKTSTTRFIERILREYGLRTGRFTSPHLVSLNERMSIDGEPVSDERLYSVWQDIKPILEIVDAELEGAGDTKLTFFETLAALGFAVFADAPVDVLVLEVGMGGTWDSTNVADGDVAVFTPIDLDHTERLGNTIQEIATTKAGIIKPAAIVVSAQQTIEAEEVLVRTSAEVADAFALLGSQFEITSQSRDGFGQRFSVRGLAGEYQNLFLPLLGEYQIENAAVAIAAVEAFLGGGQQPITDDVLRVALADASSPGRLQVVSRDPLVILDAAHNPQGARALAGALANNFAGQEFIGVFSVLAEKDAKGIFANLASVLSDVVITQSSSPRAIPAKELAEIASLYFAEDQIRVIQDPAAAFAWATELASDLDAGAVVVSGSISLVGDILKIQQKALETDD